jgi:hypothetical protein
MISQSIINQVRDNCPNCSKLAEEGCSLDCIQCQNFMKLFQQQNRGHNDELEKQKREYEDELEKTKSEYDNIPTYIQKYNTDMKKLVEESETPLIYPNQETIGQKIVDSIKLYDIFIHLILAPTQCGKTGCFVSLIDKCIKELNFDYRKIYIISGISSVDWVEQTKKRLPQCLHDNILHRPALKNICKQQDKTNMLIIIDEAHIAAKDKMTISKILSDEMGINIEQIKRNQIHTVLVSATPNRVSNDINEWSEYTQKYIMIPGPNYIGVEDLKNKGQLFQAIDLCGNESEVSKELRDIKNKIKKMPKKLHHIFRLPTGKKYNLVENRIRSVFPILENEDESFNILEYSGKDCNKLITKLEVEDLDRHCIILIKDTMRCTVTLNKKTLGIIYERMSKKIDDSVIIQGNRHTGYDVEPYNIIYTNIHSFDNYIKLWKDEFKNDAEWNFNGKNKKSFIHPSKYGAECIEKYIKEKEPIIKEFKSYEEAKQFYDDVLREKFKGTGPRAQCPEHNGFYHNHIRGETKIMTIEEVRKDSKWGISDSYRCHYCYTNIDDNSTLVILLIYYDK